LSAIGCAILTSPIEWAREYGNAEIIAMIESDDERQAELARVQASKAERRRRRLLALDFEQNAVGDRLDDEAERLREGKSRKRARRDIVVAKHESAC
jgi:hypothetical protein